MGVWPLFQSPRPRGARLAGRRGRCGVRCFNSRAREGRDSQMTTRLSGTSSFQSTRPRGARRPCAAPHGFCRMWFQSTRPRGARLDHGLASFAELMFQSTRPRGARRYRDGGNNAAGSVSIHAPARGATGLSRGGGVLCVCFNPRAREGRDASDVPVIVREVWFQSTRPRGARRVQISRGHAVESFNPRAREGRD